MTCWIAPPAPSEHALAAVVTVEPDDAAPAIWTATSAATAATAAAATTGLFMVSPPSVAVPLAAAEPRGRGRRPGRRAGDAAATIRRLGREDYRPRGRA